jgi:hypothetical protein
MNEEGTAFKKPFSLAPSLISLFPLDFVPSYSIILQPDTLESPPPCPPHSPHIPPPHGSPELFSVTTIKRLDFKGKS